MTGHGWERDAWPELWERVLPADVLILGTLMWARLGLGHGTATLAPAARTEHGAEWHEVAGARRDPTPDRDASLIAALCAGDEEAFRTVLDRYADRFSRLTLGLLRGPADAEDAVQETFITLAARPEQFAGRSQLGTWLYRVAHNHALLRFRRPNRRPCFSPER